MFHADGAGKRREVVKGREGASPLLCKARKEGEMFLPLRDTPPPPIPAASAQNQGKTKLIIMSKRKKNINKNESIF